MSLYFLMKALLVVALGCSVVNVACDASECRGGGAPNPSSDVFLMAHCEVAKLTTNCAARHFLNGSSVTFSPVVTETCNVELVYADGEVVTGTLSFQPGTERCGPAFDGRFNGQLGAMVSLSPTCASDAGTDAGLDGD